MNEKLILETLGHHTERMADLQLTIAGLTALVISRLPNLSPEQIKSLQNDVEIQKKDAEILKSGAIRLREALEKL